MNAAERARYQDIVELAGRWFAFAKRGEGTMPRVLTDLIAEAVELRGGWSGFTGDAEPGTANLPAADATIDEIIDRANALRLSRAGVETLTRH